MDDRESPVLWRVIGSAVFADTTTWHSARTALDAAQLHGGGVAALCDADAMRAAYERGWRDGREAAARVLRDVMPFPEPGEPMTPSERVAIDWLRHAREEIRAMVEPVDREGGSNG